MKYFAIIDGEQRGPFELDRLADAGVRPETYVWCKGMEDWIKAEDDAEICRMFRRRISSLMHPGSFQDTPSEDLKEKPSIQSETDADVQGGVSRIGFGFPDAPFPEETNPAIPPRPTLLVAVFVTVFCFFPTGIAAIYYSIKSQKCWNASRLSQGDESKAMQHEAHTACRSARMWTGISFFLGMIVWAFLVRFF